MIVCIRKNHNKTQMFDLDFFNYQMKWKHFEENRENQNSMSRQMNTSLNNYVMLKIKFLFI